MRSTPPTLLSVIILLLAACAAKSTSTPDAGCVDEDHDGIDSCHDCDDHDSTTFPGAIELCDGKDHDCDGAKDNACACTAGGRPCGDQGVCKQTCGPSGWGSCLPLGKATVSLKTDINNCGQCGHTCTALHATAVCTLGVCGRGPCLPGFYDLDPAIPGCETACAGGACTDPDGGVVNVTSGVVPETGEVRHAMASGNARGVHSNVSDHYVHAGTLGDSTAAFVPDDAADVRSDKFIHRGGFVSPK